MCLRGRGSSPRPPPAPQPITHARAPIRTLLVYQLCSREQRALCVEGGGGSREGRGGWVGNVRRSLGRSNFSCREVASRCLRSGSFALDVSLGRSLKEAGELGAASRCLGAQGLRLIRARWPRLPAHATCGCRGGPAASGGGRSLPWAVLTCSARLPRDA